MPTIMLIRHPDTRAKLNPQVRLGLILPARKKDGVCGAALPNLKWLLPLRLLQPL